MIKGTSSDISNKNLQRFVETNDYRQGTNSQTELQSVNRPLIHQISEERNQERAKF